MSSFLVTGGMGFVGSNLALALEHLGHEVTIVDRDFSPCQNLAGATCRKIEADVCEPFSVEGHFDAIFHQASLTDPRYENDEETLRQNVQGFQQILKLAQTKKAKLIYASTAGLYGNGPVPMMETQEKFPVTAYGRSKLEIERLADIASAKMEIVGLRYFNVFGPRETHKGRPASMIYHLGLAMAQGKTPRLFNFGEQQRDHIYVNDVVTANLRALTTLNGVFNVGTGVGVSFNELVSVLNEVLQTELKPEYFEMPYDPATYQFCTIAETSLAESKLKFKAQWNFKNGVTDYMKHLALGPFAAKS